MKKIVLLFTMLFMVSPAFADDYLYTNKDLEKYKTPPHNILQPPGGPVEKSAKQAKKVSPSRKKHRKGKLMHSMVPSKHR